VLLNTAYPKGRAPPLAERGSFDQVVAVRRPVVGRLSRGADGAWGIPVRVPVLYQNRLRFVLTGVVKPDAILEVVNRQRVHPDWVVSVFDATRLRVARSRAHEKYIGTLPSETLQALIADGAREGVGYSHVLEGDAAYTAFSHAKDTG